MVSCILSLPASISEGHKEEKAQIHQDICLPEDVTKLVDFSTESDSSYSSDPLSSGNYRHQGQGAHCKGKVSQGRWSSLEGVNHINWLELWTIRLALVAFQNLLRKKNLCWCTQTMAKAYINGQGGTRSMALFWECNLLFDWVENNVVSLKAEHLQAYEISKHSWLAEQKRFRPRRMGLNKEIFQKVTLLFGIPILGFFATPKNNQPDSTITVWKEKTH